MYAILTFVRKFFHVTVSLRRPIQQMVVVGWEIVVSRPLASALLTGKGKRKERRKEGRKVGRGMTAAEKKETAMAAAAAKKKKKKEKRKLLTINFAKWLAGRARQVLLCTSVGFGLLFPFCVGFLGKLFECEFEINRFYF
jgi:hypothetical protein